MDLYNILLFSIFLIKRKILIKKNLIKKDFNKKKDFNEKNKFQSFSLKLVYKKKLKNDFKYIYLK